MILTTEAVDAYQELMTNPQKHGFEFPSLKDVFEETEGATAKHILFKQYIDLINKPLPKIFFYIIMDKLYHTKKASDGNLGYCVKIVYPKETTE